VTKRGDVPFQKRKLNGAVKGKKKKGEQGGGERET